MADLPEGYKAASFHISFFSFQIGKAGFSPDMGAGLGLQRAGEVACTSPKILADKEVKTGWGKRMRANCGGYRKGPRSLYKVKEQGRRSEMR